MGPQSPVIHKHTNSEGLRAVCQKNHQRLNTCFFCHHVIQRTSDERQDNRACGCWSRTTQRRTSWVPGKRTESPAQPSPHLSHCQGGQAEGDRVPGTEPGDALILYPGGHPQTIHLNKSLKCSKSYFLHQKNGSDKTTPAKSQGFMGT